jgi:RNA-directed DNA polymerase
MTGKMKTSWHDIDWMRANTEVRELQDRVLEAYKKGEMGEVSHLQMLISQSFAARALAVRRVTSTDGKNTPGVDNTVWDTPSLRMQAVLDLKARMKDYKASPVRRVWISKDGKPVQKDKSNARPLGIPTMFDRAMQALWKMALEPIAEHRGDPHSYGGRSHRSAHDAISAVFQRFSQRYSPLWVLEGDIEKCFDRISHEWILKNIPMDKRILNEFLKAGFFEGGQRWETEAGVPQGGVISPVISNMTLDGLEKVVQEAVAPLKAVAPRADGRYPTKVSTIRYADDFVVSGANRQVLEEVVKPAVTSFLAERGLKLSDRKTTISYLWDGFDFLGFNVRLYKDQTREHGSVLLIKPSKKSITRVRDTLANLATSPRITTEAHLIEEMNPVLRGWAGYFRTAVSKKVFSDISHYTWTLTWRWLRRKYPTEGRKALRHRHYKRIKDRNWVFVGEREGRTIQLFDIRTVKIVRKTWLDTKKNPFDPADREYFAKWGRRNAYISGWDKVAERLIRRQKGICPVCNDFLHADQSVEKHHIVPRKHGGHDRASNLILLHDPCHKQVTHCKNKKLLKQFIAKGVLTQATEAGDNQVSPQ